LLREESEVEATKTVLDAEVSVLHEDRHRKQEESVIPTTFKVVTVAVYSFMLLPIVIVVLASLNAGEFLTFPPDGFSLRWVRNFLATETIRAAFFFSLTVAFSAAVISTIVGTMTAMWLVRALKARTRAAAAVLTVLLTPIVLPGIAVGFALFVFYNNLGISNTTPGLVLAHVVASIPFVVIVVTATLYGLDPELELAARSLGMSPWRATRKVTLPLAAPGVLAGFLFAFIVSFGQAGLSLFLTPPNRSTLPLALYFYLRYQFDPTPAAAGTFSIIIVIVSVILLNWLTPLGRLSGVRTK
jgi:putative spermidine/putrescine transport system permease protein